MHPHCGHRISCPTIFPFMECVPPQFTHMTYMHVGVHPPFHYARTHTPTHHAMPADKKRKFKRCRDDDPAWWDNAAFQAMTAQERAAFRRREATKRRRVAAEQEKQLAQKAAEEDAAAQRAQELAPFPGTPPLVWMMQLLDLVSRVFPVKDAIELLTALARVDWEMHTLASRDAVWKPLHARLVDEHPITSLGGLPLDLCESWPQPGGADNWKLLTLRIVPVEWHHQDCRHVTKGRILSSYCLKEHELWGRVRCIHATNPHCAGAAPMVLVRTCTLNKLTRVLGDTVVERIVAQQGRKARKAELWATRESKLATTGLDALRQVVTHVDMGGMLVGYLANGKGWAALKTMGARWQRVVTQLFGKTMEEADSVAEVLCQRRLEKPLFQLLHGTIDWDGFTGAFERARALAGALTSAAWG